MDKHLKYALYYLLKGLRVTAYVKTYENNLTPVAKRDKSRMAFEHFATAMRELEKVEEDV